MPVDTGPELCFGVAKEELPWRAEALARGESLKQGRRGCRKEQMLLSLVYRQCAGGVSSDTGRTLRGALRVLRCTHAKPCPSCRTTGLSRVERSGHSFVVVESSGTILSAQVVLFS